jgi:hypothetical protein
MWLIIGGLPFEGFPHSLLAFRTKSFVAEPPLVTLVFNENHACIRQRFTITSARYFQ